MAYDPEEHSTGDKKSVFGIIVHSFFVIPFLLAIFSVLLFTAVRILTMEQRTAYDYLEDVHTGGLTKRWQSAFELSKILANPKLIPDERRFYNQLASAFEKSKHDDDRVRRYLSLAMARTGNDEFVQPLIDALPEEKEDNLYAIIYSLGLLKDKRAVSPLLPYLEHSEPRIRLATVMSLGNIGDTRALPKLQSMLNDDEDNVQWDAAIALAKMGDSSGKSIILNLLNREFLAKFPEVDNQEQTHVMLVAIDAAGNLRDPQVAEILRQLFQTDKNMNVRQSAMSAIKKINSSRSPQNI